MISVTGAALVFRDEIELAISAKYRVTLKDKRANLQHLISSVESSCPGYRVSGIIDSGVPDLPLKIYVEQASQYRCFFVDQYSGQVLGEAKTNKILQFLQDLHFDLLFQRNGRIANACGGAMLCVLGLSGIMIWWRGLRRWTHGLRINLKGSFKRINFGLHNAVGFWTLPLALIWGLSGIYFGFRPQFSKAVSAVFPVTAPIKMEDRWQSLPPNVPLDGGADMLIDEMVAKACSRVPNRRIERLSIPATGKGVLQIWLMDPKSIRTDESIEVDLDPSTGRFVCLRDPQQRRSGDMILIWLTRLHLGNFGGTAIKIIWVCFGLTPALLAITGILMWWHRTLRKTMDKEISDIQLDSQLIEGHSKSSIRRDSEFKP
jgi:uncharacterized iron-regulated membrane protein